jgi:hypothetical protein
VGEGFGRATRQAAFAWKKIAALLVRGSTVEDAVRLTNIDLSGIEWWNQDGTRQPAMQFVVEGDKGAKLVQ